MHNDDELVRMRTKNLKFALLALRNVIVAAGTGAIVAGLGVYSQHLYQEGLATTPISDLQEPLKFDTLVAEILAAALQTGASNVTIYTIFSILQMCAPPVDSTLEEILKKLSTPILVGYLTAAPSSMFSAAILNLDIVPAVTKTLIGNSVIAGTALLMRGADCVTHRLCGPAYGQFMQGDASEDSRSNATHNNDHNDDDDAASLDP